MFLKNLPVLIVLLLLSACATAPAPGPASNAAEPRSVLLISIDGFRRDYIDRGVTPVLSGLAQQGVRATSMRPSFPSVTFPNHYTIVTGLRPDHHGVVNNYMTDDSIPGAVFKLSDRQVLADPRWWNEGEPIWVTAEKAGLRTATLFWPGSETEIRGKRPSEWLPFDDKLPYAERVDRVLGWLERPTDARPRFVTLYFSSVDTQGHKFGPDSPEVNAALADVDAALGRLVDGLRARKLDNAVDLIVVSDHGMAATAPERAIDLDKVIDPKAVRLDWLARAFVGLTPMPGRDHAVEKKLLKRHEHFECWRKEKIPARFHFGAHHRIPPVFCLADSGWILVSTARPDTYPMSGGTHGYDNEAPDMGGLFVASGPSFRKGVTTPAFDNVDLHPLMLKLLGLPPIATDGDAATLKGALAVP
jgi:predicted AlkP superfamily pyrophosphatase or phosphodiesterase